MQDEPLTRTDIAYLLCEAGGPDRLNLSGRNLSGIDLTGFNLEGSQLSGANLSKANLSRANLSQAQLNGANLNGANLSGGCLAEANLTDADLTNTVLVDANLFGAHNLTVSQIYNAIYDATTQFDVEVDITLPRIPRIRKSASSSPAGLINGKASTFGVAPASVKFSLPLEISLPETPLPSSLPDKELPIKQSIRLIPLASSSPASSTNPKKTQHKWLFFVVRISVTLLLFVFLFRSVSWPILLATLVRVHHTDLLIGLALGMLGVIISSYVWRSLVLAEHIHTDLARLINLFLVGIAFSHFLPTSMGGDAIKAFYLGRESGNMPGSTSAVLMSRITGFLGMLLMALPALLIFHAHFKARVVIGFLLLCLLWVAAIGGSIFTAALLPRVSTRLLKGAWAKHKTFTKVLEIGSALSRAVRRPRAMCVAILFGTLFWVTTCLNYYAYGIALGLHVPLSFYVIAIPFGSILASLPISINGFGVRESFFVYLFSTIHVPASTALLLALLMDAQRILFGIIGGCIYLTMDRKTKVTQETLHERGFWLEDGKMENESTATATI